MTQGIYPLDTMKQNYSKLQTKLSDFDTKPEMPKFDVPQNPISQNRDTGNFYGLQKDSQNYTPMNFSTQKTLGNLFNDEKELLAKMLDDGVDEELAKQALTKMRQNVLKRDKITKEEEAILLKMMEDGVSSNMALQAIEKMRKDSKSMVNKVADVPFGIIEGAISQVPKFLTNTAGFTQGFLGGASGYVGSAFGVDREDNPFYKTGKEVQANLDKKGSEAKQKIKDIGLAENETISQGLGEMATNIAGTTLLPGGQQVQNLGKVKTIPGLIGAGAKTGAMTTPGFMVGSEGRLPTMGEMALGTAGGAIANPILDKAVIPAVGTVLNKTSKYLTAGAKGGFKGLGKSVSRDVKNVGNNIKKIPEKISNQGTNMAESLSTKSNRFNAVDEEKFRKLTGESSGKFAVSRGMNKTGREAVEESAELFKSSMKEADNAFASLEGRFKQKITTERPEDYFEKAQLLLIKRLKETDGSGKQIKKLEGLLAKYKEGGLELKDWNKIKRDFANEFKFDWNQRASVEAKQSTNLQNHIRNAQFDIAKEQGLTNIADINKNTQAWRMYTDSLSKRLTRSEGNNAVSLTDWITISGGTPESIALFLGKKGLSSNKVKGAVISTLGKQTKEPIIKPNFIENVTSDNIIPNRGVPSINPGINAKIIPTKLNNKIIK